MSDQTPVKIALGYLHPAQVAQWILQLKDWDDKSIEANFVTVHGQLDGHPVSINFYRFRQQAYDVMVELFNLSTDVVEATFYLQQDAILPMVTELLRDGKVDRFTITVTAVELIRDAVTIVTTN